MITLCSEADDFNATGYAAQVWNTIENVDGDSLTQRNSLIVVDTLMDDAHQMRLRRMLHFESKRSLRVGIGACLLLRARLQTLCVKTRLAQTGLNQPKKNDFVSSSELAASLIADDAGSRVRGERRRGTNGHEDCAQDDFVCRELSNADSYHRLLLLLLVGTPI